MELKRTSGTKGTSKGLNQVVKEAKKESKKLVSDAKAGAMAAYWGDAFKYGLATSVITVLTSY